MPDGLPPLPTDDLHSLLIRAQSGCSKSKNLVVLHNLGLVRREVVRYRATGVEPADLFSAGAMGLLRAVDLWRMEMGFRFTTYAGDAIRRAVQRELNDVQQAIRWPEYIHARASQDAEFRGGLPVVSASLNKPLTDDGAEMGELVADPSELPPDELARCQYQQRRSAFVRALLQHLSPAEAATVCLVFGLDEEGHSAAGFEGRLTLERLRQLDAQSMRKLRRFVRNNVIVW
jgi:RNA polymerase sigma factor (sigma-70 family)